MYNVYIYIHIYTCILIETHVDTVIHMAGIGTVKPKHPQLWGEWRQQALRSYRVYQ